jgi:hypothetical protein
MKPWLVIIALLLISPAYASENLIVDSAFPNPQTIESLAATTALTLPLRNSSGDLIVATQNPNHGLPSIFLALGATINLGSASSGFQLVTTSPAKAQLAADNTGVPAVQTLSQPSNTQLTFSFTPSPSNAASNAAPNAPSNAAPNVASNAASNNGNGEHTGSAQLATANAFSNNSPLNSESSPPGQHVSSNNATPSNSGKGGSPNAGSASNNSPGGVVTSGATAKNGPTFSLLDNILGGSGSSSSGSIGNHGNAAAHGVPGPEAGVGLLGSILVSLAVVAYFVMKKRKKFSRSV